MRVWDGHKRSPCYSSLNAKVDTGHEYLNRLALQPPNRSSSDSHVCALCVCVWMHACQDVCSYRSVLHV